MLCFFFQAEDGIRDLYVTGVQTCALPISPDCGKGPENPDDLKTAADDDYTQGAFGESVCALDNGELNLSFFRAYTPRSEERRVGKECRSRGRPHRVINKRDTRPPELCPTR